MKDLAGRRMARAIGAAALVVVGFLIWGGATWAHTPPDLRLYGTGAVGDTVTVTDAAGEELGSAVVDSNGAWYVDVPIDEHDLERLRFQVNGVAVDAEIYVTGDDQAEVRLAVDEESAVVEESLEGEDAMSESNGAMLDTDGETSEAVSAMSEAESEESEQQAYPVSGTGGLSDDEPSTSALIGTLVVLGVLALSLGVYRLLRARGRA